MCSIETHILSYKPSSKGPYFGGVCLRSVLFADLTRVQFWIEIARYA